MIEAVVALLLLAGSALFLVAGIALHRLPDVYMRTSANAKALTLGMGCILLALVLHFRDLETAAVASLVSVFFAITSPTAAQMIGRAAYLSGSPLWPGTRIDELAGHYDPSVYPLGGRYQAVLSQLAAERGLEGAPAIIPRYLVRLGAYGSALAALCVVARWLAACLAPWEGIGLAAGSALIVTGLPIALLVAKYLSHLFLLAATRLLERPVLAKVFALVDIRRLYGIFHLSALASIGAASAWAVAPNAAWWMLAASAALFAWAATLAAGRLSSAIERIERRLDRASGLATSEPTRFAVLALGRSGERLEDLVDRVLLSPDAYAAGRTIRDLQLRTKTGVTVAAIYRGGAHIADPDPGIRLAGNDVLVLLGEPARRAAAGILLEKGNASP